MFQIKKIATDDAATFATMADTYPMMGKSGDKGTLFTFRFPTFDKEIVYDPSVQMFLKDGSTTGGASMIGASLISMLVAAVVAHIGSL